MRQLPDLLGKEPQLRRTVVRIEKKLVRLKTFPLNCYGDSVRGSPPSNGLETVARAEGWHAFLDKLQFWHILHGQFFFFTEVS